MGPTAAGDAGGAEPVARIRLRVAPGSDRARIVGRHGDGWKVRVDAPPERGKANARLQQLLADIAGVHRSAVSVVSGAASRDKLLAVAGIDDDSLARLLDAASGK